MYKKKIFNKASPLNQKEITQNAEDVLKMRYFIDKDDGTKETTFSELAKRVARVLTSFDESSDLEYKINVEKSIYNDMVSQRFLFNSPCLFNSGKGISNNPKLSKYLYSDEVNEEILEGIRKNQNGCLFACFVISIPDSLEGIFDSVKKAALISKAGGGVGGNFGKLREKNCTIKNGELGKASGPVSFMKVWNTMGEVVMQGGARRAALMGMLNSNHPDIEDFIDAKTEEGVLSYFNISVAIDSLFMNAVKEDLDYCLISPKDNAVVRTVKARDLFDKICGNAWKRGDPGIFFIDLANEDNLLKLNEEWKIESTNPCCTGDTLVATPNGYKYAKDINEGDELVTVLGVEKIKTKEVNENIPIYKVTTSDGCEIKVTASHQFHAMKKNIGKIKPKKFEHIQLRNLEVGDYIRVSPTMLPNNKIDTFGFEDYDFGLIIGSLIGDGCITDNAIERKHIAMCFGKHEIEWQKIFETLLNKYDVKYRKNDKDTTNGLVITDERIYNIITKYNLNGYSYDKRISLDLINSNKEVLRGIISGYYSTDGNVNMSTSNPSIRLKSCNKGLIDDVRNILLMFGIFSTCHVTKRNLSVITGRLVNSRDVYQLTTTGESVKTFIKEIGISNPYKNSKLKELLLNYGFTGNSWKVVIKSIELVGNETVYDFYCPIADNWITNGLVSVGCGEQPLANETSCNLGSINLYEFVNKETKEFDWEEFGNQIIRSIYYLDLVIDATKYPLPIIEKRTKAIRPVGLGIMGLADTMIELGMIYGSRESLNFCDKIACYMAEYSLLASIELAKIKGAFKEYNSVLKLLNRNVSYNKIVDELNIVFDGSLNFNPLTSEELDEDDWVIKLIERNSKYKKTIIDKIFSQLVDEESNVPFTFKNTMRLVYNFDKNFIIDLFTIGLRNSRRLSIAPTGSISMILNTSSAIEPNFAFEWDRYIVDNTDNTGTNRVLKKFYHKLNTPDNKEKGLLVTANELDWKTHIEVVKVFAQFIDSAISKTVNIPEEATIDEIKDVYMYCFDNHIKGTTVYRNNSRNSQPIISKDNNSKCEDKIDVEYNTLEKLPEWLPAVRKKVKTDKYGSLYVITSFYKGKPCEVYISAGKSGSQLKSAIEAISRVISIGLRSGISIDNIVRTMMGICESDVYVYDALDGSEELSSSIPDTVSRIIRDTMRLVKNKDLLSDVLKHIDNTYKEFTNNYIDTGLIINTNTKEIKENDKKEVCPKCGSDKYILESGCHKCLNCGYSPCG